MVAKMRRAVLIRGFNFRYTNTDTKPNFSAMSFGLRRVGSEAVSSSVETRASRDFQGHFMTFGNSTVVTLTR